ncbi:hypothetical protein KVT40_003878 [Elsinoe batatas]|uniref:alpha-D-xyloside xylohydrolase n=1 Tax=Elsinoe batatas TaxID=2601811 RepID=A0A8K0PDF5_9PEZI|nr:hypothetical protein KVT40_003878 [Elsinoe batatas]
MKFRDGMWLPAVDKHVEYAEEVYEALPSPDNHSLSLLCPTRQIHSRGDSLNRPTITVDLEAIADGIISVTATHWHGALDKGPHCDLFPGGKPEVQARIETTDAATVLHAGDVRAEVSRTPHTFGIKFKGAGGEHLTELGGRSVAFAYSPPPGNQHAVESLQTPVETKHFMLTQTTLAVGEGVYGLGERFGAFNKVGQSVSLWNADGGTSSDQAYKNVSFWMSNRGYGVFIDHLENVDLEIGSERSCRVQTSVEGQRLKWYVIYGGGKGAKGVLERYTQLTGRAKLMPEWSYGLWLSTSFTTEYDDATVKSFLDGMRERDIEVSVFHYDCYWLRAFRWCDFTFDPEKFPDPEGSIKSVKQGGTKAVSVWTNPYISQRTELFQEAVEKGYLVKRTNGDVWQWDLWQTGMGLVDFTNPDACTWYAGIITKLLKMGVDSIKTDFGERIPTKDVKWFDGKVDNQRMHNWYAFIYNKCVYEAVEKFKGENNAVLFARAACAGTQRYPLVWGGDCESTFEAMAESLRGGISLGLCGYSFWSVDIGGFEGTPPPAVYKRWVQFGLLCSHSRLHGSNSYRVPWLVDDDDKSDQGCTAVLRKMTKTKATLMPYLLNQAKESAANGLPLSVRAMGIEFPDDRTAWSCDQQFMLGSQLLVAPVFNEEGEVDVYLPEGKWTSFWDSSVTKEGPRWYKEKHDFTTLPLYIRPGADLQLAEAKSS